MSKISPSERLQNDAKPPSDQPNRLPPIKKYSKKLLVSPRLGGEDRDFPDPQVRIQTKIRVNPSKEPISKPSNTYSVPEYKCAKRSPAKHTIRKSWTKESKHTGKSSQEYLQAGNKKFHPLEPQSI